MIEFAPTASIDVVNIACPVPSRFDVPRVDVPFLKVTVPVGVPVFDVTLAVNVTDWLKTDGLAEELAVVAVAETTCTTSALLDAKVVSEA